MDRTQNCDGTNNPNQPFAYIHLIGEGGLSFDTLVFTQGRSGGFEFDNMAIARNIAPPTTAVVSFPPELNAGTPTQQADTCTPFESTFALTVSNFSASPTFTITPTLPAGLSLNAGTGQITGTPTQVLSPTAFTLTATAGDEVATENVTLSVLDAGNLPCIKPVPVVEWVPEVTEFDVTEFPIIVTPPPPPPSPSGEAYTFTKDPTTTSNCTVDATTSTLTVPQPGTCVVTASTPETDDFAEFSITTTYTFTKAEPQLAATGTATPAAWLMFAGAAAVVTGLVLVMRRRDISP